MSGVAIYRSIYTEDQFARQFNGPKDEENVTESFQQTERRSCACPGNAGKQFWRRRLPFLTWLPRYKIKQWLIGDIIAGLTVGIIHIPQGMSFALLTSVAPIYGLYTSFFPVVFYVFFGTGRHVSTGTFAGISLMTGSVVERLVPHPSGWNVTTQEDPELEKQRISVASAVTFLSGLMMICMFVLQLGFLSTYLSDPIVKAFTSGTAFHVTVSQLNTMLGLRLPRFTGPFTLFKTLASLLGALAMTNIVELIISLICLSVLIPMKEINSRFQQKLRTPIPIEIIMLIVATAVTFATSLDERCNVQIVGHIPAGFPSPQLPALGSIPNLVGDTVAITFVGYAVSVSLAMIYADKHRYKIDPNQELLAHGISNTVASFFTCFPSSASLATSNILESAGSHTQLAGFFTCLVVLAVLLLIGPLFYFLPKAVLACINITSLRQMFLQFQDLPQLWRVSRMDFMVWVVTWLAVITLNADLGLAVGVVFSMMTVIYRTQRADCSVLGRASNTEIYRPMEENSMCHEIPGLKILAYNAPIYYGNKSFFRDAMTRLIGLTQEKMKARAKTRKELKKMAVATVENGLARAACSSDKDTSPAGDRQERIQSVIIDCSSIIFIDTAGARLFVQMCVECQKADLWVYLAECNKGVLRALTCSGLLEHLRPEQIFVTVHDAVVHLEQVKILCKLNLTRNCNCSCYA
ncbi:solute carrier family 26 member 10 isoform X1 [Hypanus sabinus]|uniref:solute carrier family 26 member 10 isoform X1 n=1 Tax=Hypanus sabinus TaxID=79690 RepID=UPI0028C41D27|nr:solute carrier family 26 member 10 isoform X1 [Hypanus sabinus]XP_059812100.1 solute carrier family 26 member 10 isoform X1 [Hypanus sabinus]XP_059812101.1 solute carrier family 26 member 10 isoform X1 [Hypanus sabinus]